MTRYSKDPRVITVRYSGKCSKCGEPVNRGEDAFYYPIGKKLLGMRQCSCGHEAQRDFTAAAEDEAFMQSQF